MIMEPVQNGTTMNKAQWQKDEKWRESETQKFESIMQVCKPQMG